MPARELNLKDCVIIIGYDPDGNCVYSSLIDHAEYYDGEHAWDKGSRVIELHLRRLKGFIFDMDGVLQEEFESTFNLQTGIYEKGKRRFADGTEQND
ncbi:MAG: hypothetical protein AAGD22_01120 [Verrucomicrobiota bacterium]